MSKEYLSSFCMAIDTLSLYPPFARYILNSSIDLGKKTSSSIGRPAFFLYSFCHSRFCDSKSLTKALSSAIFLDLLSMVSTYRLKSILSNIPWRAFIILGAGLMLSQRTLYHPSLLAVRVRGRLSHVPLVVESVSLSPNSHVLYCSMSCNPLE